MTKSKNKYISNQIKSVFILKTVLSSSSDLYINLRKYLKGEISKRDLEYSDSKIDRVVEGDEVPYIIFEFSSLKSLLENLNLNSDDIDFATAIWSRFSSGWSFRDSYSVEEDFKAGYLVWGELSEDNADRLRDILKVLDPKTDYEEFDQENAPTAYQVLEKIFPRETDEILNDWRDENESASNEAAEEEVKKQINDFLSESNFELISDHKVKISIPNLINLYVSVGKPWLSFKKLFDTYFHEVNDRQLGGWAENYWEYENIANFDRESFNKNVSYSLDRMESKLEDLENIKEYIKLLDRITSKFKIGQTYKLPKLSDVEFRIRDIDREKLKINVVLRKGLKTINRSLSEENFYHLLYQPELFYSEFGSI